MTVPTLLACQHAQGHAAPLVAVDTSIGVQIWQPGLVARHMTSADGLKEARQLT